MIEPFGFNMNRLSVISRKKVRLSALVAKNKFVRAGKLQILAGGKRLLPGARARGSDVTLRSSNLEKVCEVPRRVRGEQ